MHVMTCIFFAMHSRLQAELKQTKPFPRRSSEALLSVLRTAALLEHQLNEALRPSGITDLQYNVLRILRGAGPDGWCGREISERLVSKVPDVSRLLDRMEGMQLLRRERDETDRRRNGIPSMPCREPRHRELETGPFRVPPTPPVSTPEDPRGANCTAVAVD